MSAKKTETLMRQFRRGTGAARDDVQRKFDTAERIARDHGSLLSGAGAVQGRDGASKGGQRQIVTVPILKVFDNPFNARGGGYDPDTIRERARSIEVEGQKTPCPAVFEPPLAGWKHGPGTYALLDGGYRRRALMELGRETIDLLPETVSTPAEFYKLSRLYNRERDNGSALDDALAWSHLLESKVVQSQEDIAGLVGMTKSQVAKILAMLKLPGPVLDHIRDEPTKFGATIAYELYQFAQVAPVSDVIDVAIRIRQDSLSRAELEQLVREARARDGQAPPVSTRRPHGRTYPIGTDERLGTLKEWDDGRVKLDLRLGTPQQRIELVDLIKARFGVTRASVKT